MSIEERFLEALQKNEDDTDVRLVYADWLDEQGNIEESDRMRSWPKAKQWMVSFADRCKEEIYANFRGYCDTEEEFNEWIEEGDDAPMTYQELIELGLSAYREATRDKYGEITSLDIYFGRQESMMYHLIREQSPFWKNWSIITGHPIPEDPEDVANFRCSC